MFLHIILTVLFYPGNLYFANVLETDGLDGATYLCTVYNTFLRGMATGDDQIIEPTGGTVLTWITSQ